MEARQLLCSVWSRCVWKSRACSPLYTNFSRSAFRGDGFRGELCLGHSQWACPWYSGHLCPYSWRATPLSTFSSLVLPQPFTSAFFQSQRAPFHYTSAQHWRSVCRPLKLLNQLFLGIATASLELQDAYCKSYELICFSQTWAVSFQDRNHRSSMSAVHGESSAY